MRSTNQANDFHTTCITGSEASLPLKCETSIQGMPTTFKVVIYRLGSYHKDFLGESIVLTTIGWQLYMQICKNKRTLDRCSKIPMDFV